MTIKSRFYKHLGGEIDIAKQPNNYMDMGDETKLIIFSPTYGSVETVFDTEDIDLVQSRHWCLSPIRDQRSAYRCFYITSNKPKTIMLHRLIMGNPKGMVVDHIDGDTMNNRKSNLRICTFRENCRNRKMHRHNSSGYRGVSWVQKEQKWMAYIHLNNCKFFKNLGYFDDKEEAHMARVEAEEKYFGDYLITERGKDANQVNFITGMS